MLKITQGEHTIDVDFRTFPAGEESVRIIDPHLISKTGEPVEISILGADSSTIMKACLVADAIKRYSSTLRVGALFGYFPYGRQDRVCHSGEPFSLDFFVDMLKLRFDYVKTYDTHSKVTNDLLGYKDVPYEDHYLDNIYFGTHGITYELSNFFKGQTLICPDKGALKRTKELAECFNLNKNIIEVTKERTDDGIKMSIGEYAQNYIKSNDYKEYVIYDDIADGGATFIVLGQLIKKYNPSAKLTLIVSHAIFSKGLDTLDLFYERILVCGSDYNRNVLKGLGINV